VSEGLNQVNLLGNLGADPELRTTQGGQAVLKMRLATSKNYLDKQRQKQERTEWHNVVVWGRRAEALSKILSKGSRVFITGELRTSSWEPNDGGAKRYRTDVVALDIILSGGGRGRAESDGESFPRDADEPDYGSGDDDIPF